jgi:hypothetical protein
VRETWHLQETPNGLWLIGVTEFLHREAEEAAAEYSRSAVSFDQWFKSQVRRISGIDPDTQPLGPPTECIFDTREI